MYLCVCLHKQIYIIHSLVLNSAFYRRFLGLQDDFISQSGWSKESLSLDIDYWVWLCAKKSRVHSIAPQARNSFCSLPYVQCRCHFCCSPSSCIQVLVESTTFLFFISVAMFFPGLPSPALRAHRSCSHQATPRLVAHHSLDSFGQSSHIFLVNKRKYYLRYQQSPFRGYHGIIYGELQDSGLPPISLSSFLPII